MLLCFLQERAGESEDAIQRALYCGNYGAAVDACFKVQCSEVIM